MFHRVRFCVCLNFASSGLLTYFWRFCESSPVQSTSVKWLVTPEFSWTPLTVCCTTVIWCDWSMWCWFRPLPFSLWEEDYKCCLVLVLVLQWLCGSTQMSIQFEASCELLCSPSSALRTVYTSFYKPCSWALHGNKGTFPLLTAYQTVCVLKFDVYE